MEHAWETPAIRSKDNKGSRFASQELIDNQPEGKMWELNIECVDWPKVYTGNSEKWHAGAELQTVS